MIDSHAHIGEEVYDEDRVEVLARARRAGVDTVLVIGYDAASSRRAIELVRQLSDSPADGKRVRLYATAGVAPHHVLETSEADLGRVREALAENEVVAVGEIGLDYHYDMPRQRQRALFGRQIGWAVEQELPVVVHSREAEHDVIAALREHGCSRGVIHCFTEGPRMAEAAVEIGLFVSFAGIISFKNAHELRQIAARVPLERTLVETDSPYLAPVPHRGRRNEPAFVVEVAKVLAELHGTSYEHVDRVTSDNARRLFALPADADDPATG